MDWKTTVTLAVTIVIAFVGWIFAYRNGASDISGVGSDGSRP